MNFGLDKHGNRIRPSSTGQRATCDMCNGILIAHYGKFRQHWQHKSKKDCDSWKGKETDWHREWKSHFQKECQEIVITKDGDKHRADVKTKEDIVLEFQNSSISYSDIQARESFYENMLWVINAEEFKSHFDIHSVVYSRLRRIDEKFGSQTVKFLNDYDEEIESLEEEINQINALGKQKSRLIKTNRKNIQKLKKYIDNRSQFSNEIINSWSSDSFLEGISLPDVTYAIDRKYKIAVKKISNEIKELGKNKESFKQDLRNITKLEDYEIKGKDFKIVKYSQVSPKNYTKVKAIEKESKDTLWPKIISIKSKAQFESFSYRKDNFIFAIDPTEKINKLKSRKRDIEEKLISKKNSLKELEKEIKERLTELTKSKIEELEEENNGLETKWNKLIDKKGDITQEKEIKKQFRHQKFLEAKENIQREKEKKRSEIMRKKKGLYTYHWKNERKSWRAADCPVYFDFGEGYLFKKLDANLFKKVNISDFITKYTN